jgi:hypothetical protein
LGVSGGAGRDRDLSLVGHVEGDGHNFITVRGDQIGETVRIAGRGLDLGGSTGEE